VSLERVPKRKKLREMKIGRFRNKTMKGIRSEKEVDKLKL